MRNRVNPQTELVADEKEPTGERARPDPIFDCANEENKIMKPKKSNGRKKPFTEKAVSSAAGPCNRKGRRKASKRQLKQKIKIISELECLTKRIKSLIDYNVSMKISRFNPRRVESANEWIGRNIGRVNSATWSALQKAEIMTAAERYRIAWVAKNGQSLQKSLDESKKSIWAHFKREPAMIRVKPIKQKRVAGKCSGLTRESVSIWTCSAGLPSLGKRR